MCGWGGQETDFPSNVQIANHPAGMFQRGDTQGGKKRGEIPLIKEKKGVVGQDRIPEIKRQTLGG